jgi:uncharacterized protein (DUF3084 family)
MAQKVKKERRKLTPGEYWEWRCTIEELKSARLNKKRVDLEREIMNKEIENKKLKLALFRETVQAAQRSVENASAESEKFVRRLEEDLGTSLKGVVIDEYTYEIRSMDEPNPADLED